MGRKVIIAVIVIAFLAVSGLLFYRLFLRQGGARGLSSVVMDEETMMLNKANAELGEGELLKAKETYQKIIEKFPTSDVIVKAEEGLGDTNVAILLSSVMTPDSFLYEVQKGDSLTKIARKFNTTAELIAKANGLNNGVVRLGRKIKISKIKFSIVVDKSQNILTLKSGGEVFKTYHVSTGKNSCTPVGNFKITNKLINPVWYTAGAVVPPDSPKNILGSRWMGISQPGYGIHGTTQPQSIGKSVTAGCVRMKNSEVEELYSIVPEGTEVVIVD